MQNDDLYNLIASYEGKPLKLFVYNVESDNCREVTIIPNSNWGGSGSLGCDIGYGYLHRIPASKCEDDQSGKCCCFQAQHIITTDLFLYSATSSWLFKCSKCSAALLPATPAA